MRVLGRTDAQGEIFSRAIATTTGGSLRWKTQMRSCASAATRISKKTSKLNTLATLEHNNPSGDPRF